MFDDNAMLMSDSSNTALFKPNEGYGSERWALREKKALAELEAMSPMRKKEMTGKRDVERPCRMQGKRVGSGSAGKESILKNKCRLEEEPELCKAKTPPKKIVDEPPRTPKMQKRARNEERVPQELKPKGVRSKALSAFGTTFYRSDSPITNNRPMSSSSGGFLRKKNRSKPEEIEDEDEENLLGTKVNVSRRRLADDMEEGRGKAKPRTGKSRTMQRSGSDSSIQDEKIIPPDAKKNNNKQKVVTAFGSTFRKTDNEAFPRKKQTFTDRITRSKSTKLKDAAGMEAENEATPQGGAKAGIPKNKLMEMVEESTKNRGKGRGAYSTSTGKRAKSPYQTSSEFKANPTKVRVEGDPPGVKQMPDEKPEILKEKELTFFEKIQQNVRAYFSPRTPDLSKYEAEKEPVQEGENHANDESIMIRKEDEIMRGVKNLLTVTEVEVFEKGSTSLESGDLPERNGSGPGGNLNYTFGDSLDISYLSNHKRCKKVYYIKRGFECTEKRRPTSFHRSKTFQKNALAESTSEPSTSVGLTLEPGEQAQNKPSAYGVVSAFAQVQEFHQEITRRSGNKETPVIVQEEYLTPIVPCLPGDSVPERARRESGRTGNYRSRSRPTRKRRSNRYNAISRKTSEDNPRKIRSSRSEGTIHETNVRFLIGGLHRGDEPRKTVATKEMLKPEKPHVVPRRQWFVYSLTETIGNENRSMLTPPRQTEEGLESDMAATSTADEDIGESDMAEDTSPSGSNKTKDLPPSVTLKDIINLTRRVFQENGEDKKASAGRSGGVVARNRCPSLGYYLEKLMDEKRNYLNMQKTKNFRKTQKVNFIADSFNFFNLLNREFLSKKASNPSVETLRNIIAQNKDFNIEDYVDMYRKVIRTSLTEPERCLMDKAKTDLERYADMYYDLMKCICMENGEQKAGKSTAIRNNPQGSQKSGNTSKVNYFEILKRDLKRSVNPENDHVERIKPRQQSSFYAEKPNNAKRNLDVNSGRSTYRTSNPRKAVDKEHKTAKFGNGPGNVKQVVELLSPPKNKAATARKDVVETKKEENTDDGKVLLTISVCNGGLIINQVTEGDAAGRVESATTNFESSEDVRKKKSLPAERKYSCSRNSVSETNLGASNGTSSDEVEKTQSELLLRTESDVTVYPKSSVDGEIEGGENTVDNPILKFRAFRKLLSEGLKYLTSFGESPEAEEHVCPKIPKGGKVPEKMEQPVKYPKMTVFAKELPKKETKRFHEGCKPGGKNAHFRDARQTVVRDKRSPVRSRMKLVQEERERNPFKRNKSPFARGVSSSKFSKAESSEEERSKGKKGASFWWRNDKNAVKTTPPSKQQRTPNQPCRSSLKKPEGRLFNKTNLVSKMPKEAESSAPLSPLKEGRKISDEKLTVVPVEEVKEEVKSQESGSNYATPTGSFLEWQFGVNSLKYLLSEVPPSKPSPTVVSIGKPIEETEEKELKKMDLSVEDDTNGDSLALITESREVDLRLRSSNPLRTEWDQLLEASFHKDYKKVSEVLNQFMGNISEAWKAAKYLKDYIKMKSIEEEAKGPQEEKPRKNKAIESFRNFLRILTKIFEDNEEETSVRRELFLVMKEVLETSPTTPALEAVLNDLPYTGRRTNFHKEIALLPWEVRGMVAEELISEDKLFSRSTEDYEPGSFVSAVKDVGEKLKNLYFPESEESDKPAEKPEIAEVAEEVPKPRKIYYHPRKEKDGEEGTIMKSNLRSLAEKFNEISKGREGHAEERGDDVKEDEKAVYKKPVQAQSSVYFDAPDKFQHPEDRSKVEFRDVLDGRPEVTLNSVDESYFALSGKTFGKHRDLIYDKIITFLKSDNPYNISYGMTLLGKMMEKDSRPPSNKTEIGSIPKQEPERKWYNLVDKLIDMCQVMESEMKEQLEKRLATENQGVADEKELEWIRTCEYLKNHVDKMKELMREMKEPDADSEEGKDSAVAIKALEDSRQTNMERRLMASPELTTASFLSHKSLDNAVSLFNSIGIFGCSVEKISKGFLSGWFSAGKDKEMDLIAANEDISSDEGKDANDSVLECNKAVLKTLKKNIDKRQKKIKEMMDEVEKEGSKREERVTDERLMRKVRDLRKCYNLLEKMIYDPTMLPPRCWKLDRTDINGELSKKKGTPETEFQVLTALEGIIANTKETRLVKYSHSNSSFRSKKTVLDQIPNELLTLLNSNFTKNHVIDLPVGGQGHDEEQSLIQRPQTT